MAKFSDTPELTELRRELRHEPLVRHITEQIRTGQLAPGDQLPSFQEMRKRWGVGRDTLERMYRELEREGMVSREARRGVFVAEPKKSPKQGTIGFVNALDLQNHPYYNHLLRGVRYQAERAGVEVLLVAGHRNVPWEKMDGIIYQASEHSNIQQPHGMPRVTLVTAVAHIDSAVADDYSGTTEAMDHLWSLGHRRIAFLTSECHTHTLSRFRLAAYHSAYGARQEVLQPEWIRTLTDPGVDNRSWEEVGYEDMKRWLQEDWKDLRCTAILAHNDETAIGAIRAMQEEGLRVPEDISVVGFDGTEIAHFYRPRLSTVKVPLFEIGERGMEMLMQQINRSLDEDDTGRMPVRLTLPTKFVAAQSTGPAPN